MQEQGAVDELRRIFELSRSPLALFELATALSFSHQFDEALNCFDQLVSQGVDEPALWNNRGECLARLGRTDEAVQSFDRAIAKDPYFEAAYVGKSRTLIQGSRFSEAREVIHELLEFCSDQLRNSATIQGLLSSV